MSNKEAAIEAVRELPDEATFEDILEHIAILAAIRRGEEAADAGRVISHEEVKNGLRAIYRLRTEAEKQAAKERFERHFGEINLGSATGVDNESIDADLAREYADDHEAV